MSKPYDGKQWHVREFSSDLTIIDHSRRPTNVIFVVAYYNIESPTTWRLWQWHPDLENDTDRAMRAFLETMITFRPPVSTMRNAIQTYLGLLP